MTSLATERSWLLDPSLLKLVHQCRRLIRTEFGVKLHLTEEHLEQQLAEYASKTRSNHLTRVFASLKAQVPQLDLMADTDRADGAAPKRMYRGQPIADEPAPTETDDGEPRRRKQRIYRGQVIG